MAPEPDVEVDYEALTTDDEVIADLVAKLKETEDELKTIDDFWSDREEKLQLEIGRLTTEMEFQNLVKAQLVDPKEEETLPPGPYCLLWVQSTAFSFIAALVVMAN